MLLAASDVMCKRSLNEQVEEEEEEDRGGGDDYLSWNTAKTSEKVQRKCKWINVENCSFYVSVYQG